jgi:hypothetical protein
MTMAILTWSPSSLPIGAIAIAVIIIVLEIKRDNNPNKLSPISRIRELDLIGTSILIPTVVMLLLALQWGGSTYPWNNSHIIGLFVGFGLMAIIFIYSQIHLGDKGTLPPRLFKNRNVLAGVMFALFFGAGFFALIFYIAIYFQSVQGSSATYSGIQLLPLLISTVVSSIVTGGLISAIGYYTPIMMFCMILFATGAGLITTYDITTPFSNWFGYQVLTGAGIGVGFQGGILVVQTVLPLSDVPVGTACVSFFQTLGGALFISVAQTLFQNGLISGLREFAPDLEPAMFLNSGATAIRPLLEEIHREDLLEAVLMAYVRGLKNTFWITVACAITGFFCASTLEWKSVKKNKGVKKDVEASEISKTEDDNTNAEEEKEAS